MNTALCLIVRSPFVAAFSTLALVGLLLALPVMAQSDAEDRAEADEASAERAAPEAEADHADQPSAEQVLQELLQRRQENPLIEPSRPEDGEDGASEDEARTQVGTAPDTPRNTLKREGQFIITRRGRLARPDEGGSAPWMFVFASDGDAMADPPMLLMPCRQLETMERIVDERGMDASFIVSGRVYVYQNRNYLLPTLVKIAPDRGNVQP